VGREKFDNREVLRISTSRAPVFGHAGRDNKTAHRQG
jgi:hypothetical protein